MFKLIAIIVLAISTAGAGYFGWTQKKFGAAATEHGGGDLHVQSGRVVRTAAEAVPVVGSFVAQWQAWRKHLHRRETWGLILSRFVGDGAYYFFALWLPLYLQTERGFSILSVMWVGMVPFLFADLGSLLGGWTGQKLIQRGWSVNRSRKTMIWAGSIGALVAFPAASVDSWVLALVLVMV